MKYYITENLTLTAGVRDYQFTCDGCHIVLKINGQVSFVLYNMNNKPVTDIHTQLPVQGTLYANIKQEFYIKRGTYKLNIGYASNLSGNLYYQKQVDSNDINYKLLDDVSTDISTGLANSTYPANGRLCTVEDVFAEYHIESPFYEKGYYLAEHVKDKLVTYDNTLKGLSIKLLSVIGYENINNNPNNPASKIYKINPFIPEDEQTPPDLFLTEIINAIKEWTKKQVSDTIYNQITINENTNIYDILYRTLTYRGPNNNETPVISDTELSNITSNIKYNTPLTTEHQKQIFNTLLGNHNIPHSLCNLLDYIALQYQFIYDDNNSLSTLFPNRLNYEYEKDHVKNTMQFINASGIIQNGVLTYKFNGCGPLTDNGKNVRYGIVETIERTNQQNCTFTINHTSNPFSNNTDNMKKFTTSFYDSNGNSVFTIKKLYDEIYLPVWKSIVSDLIYNTVKIYSTPFNGSQIYNISYRTGREDSILHNKIVRICDLANITFELYNVTSPIYPWYIGSLTDTGIDNNIKKYIKKSLFVTDIQHPERNNIDTLLPTSSPYNYYNAHSFSPLWKKKRGPENLIIEYVQYSKDYTIKSNTTSASIIQVTDPVKFLLDPSANNQETQQKLSEIGLTIDNNINTGIYGTKIPDILKPGTFDDNDNNNGNGNKGNGHGNNNTSTNTFDDINTPVYSNDELIIKPNEIQNKINNSDRTKVEYYAVFPTAPNLTPNLNRVYASLSLYDKNNKPLAHNVHGFPIYQLPRQYVILFIFYEPIQSNGSTTYTILNPEDITIDEISNNYVIDPISSGPLKQDGSLVNYPAIYQLFNIKCAYRNIYDLSFNININKTTEELKKVHYKTGIYFKGIDANSSINTIKDDMRNVYDISTYINDDKTLKIDRGELNTFITVVDPNLPTISGDTAYNKISIDGAIPTDKYTCNMGPLWPTRENGVDKSITAKLTVQLYNKNNN